MKHRPEPPKRAGQDREWSKAVKDRDGRVCRRCGEMASDGAHIIRRAFGKTRHDPANGLTLCRSCHRHFGTHPAEWREWLKANVPEVYEQMARQAGAPIR